MIFGGLACNVYDKVKTTLDADMVLKKESNGLPRWYDFGVIYNNLLIEFIITSVDGATLEQFFIQQSTEESISVTFENDEWLYDTTSTFTIQSYTPLGKIDTENSEWGYSIVLSPTVELDLSALAGDRTQCTGAGYMKYSNTFIPQPDKYNYTYHTRKYTGVTHGSSFSDELPTNTHSSTKFTPIMNSGNLRSLIDDIYAARGFEFFVDFPDKSDPFGLAGGNGNMICLVSSTRHVFTHDNGDFWSIDLGLFNITTIEA